MSSRKFDLSEFDLDDPRLPGEIAERALNSGNYPYDERMKFKHYERELIRLQVELVKLLSSLAADGQRLVIVFEGRDAAGKGGTIRVVREYLNPRQARIVALPKPTEKERGEWYFQRYVSQMPTSGEMVLFDRSWYNRGVVEPVMGFWTAEETTRFLGEAPDFERMLVRDGIHLFKLWLTIGRETQLKRFHDRRHDPLKVWKISPVDRQAIHRFDEFTEAADRMIAKTHSEHAPWIVVRANDKRRARINVIRHVLVSIDYAGKDASAIEAPDPQILGFGPDFLQSAG